MSPSTERAGLGRLLSRVNSLRDVGRRRISVTPTGKSSLPEQQPLAASDAPSTSRRGGLLGEENSGQRVGLSQRLLGRIRHRDELPTSSSTHSVRMAKSLMPFLPNDKSSSRGLSERTSRGSASSSDAGATAAATNVEKGSKPLPPPLGVSKQLPPPRPAATEAQRLRHRTKRRPGAIEVLAVEVQVRDVPVSRLDTPPKTPPPRVASRQPSQLSSPSVVVGIPHASWWKKPPPPPSYRRRP